MDDCDRQKDSQIWALVTNALLAATSLIFSVESHELIHFLTGRALGIPTRFLNLTAAGVPKEDALQFPASDLAWMNAIAPLYSFIFLGLGSYLLLRNRYRFLNFWSRYWISWLTIFNLPYLGLQMMYMGTRVRPNGTGNDFATVFDYLGMSPSTRAFLGVCGLFVFVALQMALGQTLGRFSLHVDHTRDSSLVLPFPRKATAVLLAVLSFLLAVDAVPNLSGFGMWLITADYLIIALVVLTLVPWKSPYAKTLSREWLIPGILGTLLLIPFGIQGNDFLTLWVFVLPMVSGAMCFSCWDLQLASSRE